ncbi:hypothetical protein AAFP30_09505 [Gordonia sp. CPCC 205515]|uniref:hypothetical protein n=1 Tax=Gordonia sp. CPCC 205515 TaxID=3140791 RepID=UPI003AF3D2EF
MTSILAALIGIALLVVAAWAVRLQWRVGPIALAAAALCVAFAYDSLVLGAGRLIGYGSTLEALSVPRFWIHAIAIPLLIPVVGVLVARLGVEQARSRNLALGLAALVAMLILIGVIVDGVRLDLAPKDAGDMERYINAAADGVSLPVIITVLALIVLGMAALRYAQFYLLMPAAILFLATSATASLIPWVGCAGFLVMMAAIVYAMKTVADREARDLERQET